MHISRDLKPCSLRNVVLEYSSVVNLGVILARSTYSSKITQTLRKA